MAEPEDAMRRALDALVAGDILTAMVDLTPEALAAATSMSSGIATIPTPTGYTITAHDEEAGEHRFQVRFQTNLGDVEARASWREVNSAWKITSLGVEHAP